MPAENIVFLPGMMCDERLFAPQIEDLEQAIFVADMTTSDNIPDLAANVLSAAPDSFAIAGLSMGGILAFEIWRQAPDRVTHMALLDTTPYADAPERRTVRLSQIERALTGSLREIAMDELKPLYLAEKHREDQVLLDYILDMAIDQGAEVFRRQSLALKDRSDSVATLPTISCPTTIICGSEDKLCPVSMHELMAAEIPNARLVVLNECGHLSSLEQAEAVNNELQLLLRQ
jgi:pimeloyl-ACP methyl ester carboxylesterase